MAEYLSPGVYVEELPSTIKPIAGVSTSTAGFVGIVNASIMVPEENPSYDPTGRSPLLGAKDPFQLVPFPFPEDQFIAARTKLESLSEPGVRPPRLRRAATGAAPAADDVKNFRDAQTAFAVASRRKAAGQLAAEGVPVLCTTFQDFTKSFGGFSIDPDQKKLAHALYGFFNNGGKRCFCDEIRNDGSAARPYPRSHAV